MTLFGYSLEQIYLVVLIFAGLATILFMFFGEVVEGIGDGLPIFNPSVILSFFTFMSAAGFILEKLAFFLAHGT
ncbi:Membrane protein YuaF OS=Lysinibacillus sphaericus OX=1421 GN=LS41612_15775 PE=4 SV=1 [Lysinibacillus sphaericus]